MIFTMRWWQIPLFILVVAWALYLYSTPSKKANRQLLFGQYPRRPNGWRRSPDRLSLGDNWPFHFLRPIPNGNGIQTGDIDQPVTDALPTTSGRARISVLGE
jgi:hypothetical protein